MLMILLEEIKLMKTISIMREPLLAEDPSTLQSLYISIKGNKSKQEGGNCGEI